MTYCVICVAEEAAAGWPTAVLRVAGIFFKKKIKMKTARTARSRVARAAEYIFIYEGRIQE